jgi:hypothetical protein
MNEHDRGPVRSVCGLSRRGFVAAGCGVAAGMAPVLARPEKATGRMRLGVVYAVGDEVQAKPDWPNLGFDFRPVMESFNHTLANAFPDYEFPTATARGLSQANRIVARDLARGVDGYILFLLNTGRIVAPALITQTKPVLLVDFKYGGTGQFLGSSALSVRVGRKNIGFVSSSRPEDLVAAVRCFETARAGKTGFAEAVAEVRRKGTPGPGDLTCLPDPLPAVEPAEALAKMRESKVLAVGYPGVSLMSLPMIPVRPISFPELNAAAKAADRDEARAVADRWRAAAARVEGVSDETLTRSATMYLGMKALLAQHRANAITVNCLTGVYGGLTPDYPCLGFHQMLNDGLVGACECDVRSAASLLAVSAMTGGRQGYISDPALDTSTRTITYAHCVAGNRPFGADGAANPFEILTHSEDRKGASVRSLMPPGYLTTTVEFSAERRQILYHQAKTTGNDPDDRACRTKLIAEPIGDFEKLFTQWDQWGWHRVTVYGDIMPQLTALAEAMRYKLVAEA